MPNTTTVACFPDLKNQGNVDETGTQLSLTMVIALYVASLVAVTMICGTIVILVMYKRWSAKHETGQFVTRGKTAHIFTLVYYSVFNIFAWKPLFWLTLRA